MVLKDPNIIKPIFHPRIFWDVNFDTINYDVKYRFVIERVFERGDVEDIRQCRRYYGDTLLTDVLMNAKFLPQRKLYIAAAVIKKPISEFKCYKLRQLNPGLYPY